MRGIVEDQPDVRDDAEEALRLVQELEGKR
jgi:hypothetical protein